MSEPQKVVGTYENEDLRVELSGFVVDGDVTDIDVDEVYILGHSLSVRQLAIMPTDLRRELRALDVEWSNE